jgi:preprotein translocase subunit Sec61beta
MQSGQGSPAHLSSGAQIVGGVRRRVLPKHESAKETKTVHVAGEATATSVAHYMDEGSGLKLSPATVLTFSLVFIAAVVCLHIFGKLIF